MALEYILYKEKISEKALKILNPKKMFKRLPIALAQVQTGDTY